MQDLALYVLLLIIIAELGWIAGVITGKVKR